MKNITTILLLAMLLANCNTATNTNDNKNDKTDKPEQNETVLNDTIPKVTGIRGIFFRSTNPQNISEWYGKHLGLVIDNYGSAFEFRNAKNPGEINYLRWSPFEEGTD